MANILTVMVSMRDGVKLFTTVHFPENSNPKHPVILVRNCYREKGKLSAVQQCCEKGFCLVEQDVRGTGFSEGVFFPWRHERLDGEDCLNWLAAQDWCNGRIVMNGGSYLGGTQWRAAISGHPNLVALTPNVAPWDHHESPAYVGGAFMLKQNEEWGFRLWRKNALSSDVQEADQSKIVWHLPLKTMDEAAGHGVIPFWRAWLEHPDCDDFWNEMNMRKYVGQIKAPAFISGGWFDIFTQDSLDSFVQMREFSASENARKFTRCVIGPWNHGGEVFEFPCGDDFSQEKHVYADQARFTENMLLHPDADPLPETPPLRYFMLGKNEWRSAETWPVPGYTDRNLYLHADSPANSIYGGGTLSWKPPESEFADVFLYDPRNPVPTTGGHFICIVNGAHDQTELEKRTDILVYTSPVLEEDLEIAGRIRMLLYASSSARDTDFTAKLIDVYPDGRAFNIADGIRRARYRETTTVQKLLTPGEVYPFSIDLWSIANCFLKGHRVRIEISSSNFPAYDRNPNTGDAFAESDRLEIARQTVFHDALRPSHLILPVLV